MTDSNEFDLPHNFVYRARHLLKHHDPKIVEAGEFCLDMAECGMHGMAHFYLTVGEELLNGSKLFNI